MTLNELVKARPKEKAMVIFFVVQPKNRAISNHPYRPRFTPVIVKFKWIAPSLVNGNYVVSTDFISKRVVAETARPHSKWVR